MENPQTWGPAERLINTVIVQHAYAQADGCCGLSLERKITDALRAEGLLLDN